MNNLKDFLIKINTAYNNKEYYSQIQVFKDFFEFFISHEFSENFKITKNPYFINICINSGKNKSEIKLFFVIFAYKSLNSYQDMQ